VDPTAKLEYDDIRARAISRADNDDDVQGINASIELIRRTRGGSWPTEPVSVDFDYVDEIWHECEFREGGSFTYAVYDSRGQYPGCCYLYPMGRRTPLTEELLTYDVDVSWWSRTPSNRRSHPRRPSRSAGEIRTRQLSPSPYRYRRHRLPDLRAAKRWRRGVLGGLISKYEQQYENH
jgi:hypothetical protein